MASRSDLFPFIVSGPFATYRGDFYANKGDHWRKIELYLPGSPSTYGDQTLDETAHRFLKRLNEDKPYRMAIGSQGMINNTRYALKDGTFIDARNA